MKKLLALLRLLLPVGILAAGFGLIVLLVVTKPQAERRAPPEIVPKVETTVLQPEPYTVEIETQGTVRARTQSTLIPEVSGKVVEVAPRFREGGFFSRGDRLLQIDDSDYAAAVTLAEADVAEARLRLAEEEAQNRQAQEDWQRLGKDGAPNDLVLRRPQLAVARANLAAAEAQLTQARRNLERTTIRAPYDGRVLRKDVDVGQVVSPGTTLATVYAVDYAELRLPLTTAEYDLLDLPLPRRGASAVSTEAHRQIPVLLKTRFGQREVTWEGRIVRVEGAIDTGSRQVHVIAQVDDPYGTEHEEPLKVGLFVEAVIEGRTFEDVYRLPRTALREGKYVLTLTENNRLHRVAVDPLWTTAKEVVFHDREIEPGTRASLTQLALAVDGMEVRPMTKAGGEAAPAKPDEEGVALRKDEEPPAS
ncbi:MAG: efflux RND transporter periplasmic adaptor subunit [Verrucomicrobia bacterium]|jgi:RND family efflux transporter MFP subunit|nr:efflux RND transporter periplasmic adaptor subunit [Verrucomicrobiota bacterium]